MTGVIEMGHLYVRPLATALATSLLLIAGAPAQAQDSANRADEITLEEVVVTARKQSEQLLDVPLAITAFTAEAIEARGIKNLDDVAALTPGLTFSNVIGEFLPAPVIRGVAPIDIFGELNTAVFIDGIYVSGREGINFSQLDLERIEVVKGPQAALYGRNAFSGAINYVSARPTDKFSLKTELTAGNDGKQLGSIMVSGPIIAGVLRGRAALLRDEWDGSYENQWSGAGGKSDIGGYKFTTFNGALIWSPSESVRGRNRRVRLERSDRQLGHVGHRCELRRSARGRAATAGPTADVAVCTSAELLRRIALDQ